MAFGINQPGDTWKKVIPFQRKLFGTLEKEDIMLKESLTQFELTYFLHFSILMIEGEGLF